MPHSSLISHRDPTPDRPTSAVGAPHVQLSMEVEVECAHLGNPLVAVSRLLASEAEAHARVIGDDGRFTVTLALPNPEPATVDRAEAWVRWAVHNAGIRGRLTQPVVKDRRFQTAGTAAESTREPRAMSAGFHHPNRGVDASPIEARVTALHRHSDDPEWLPPPTAG